MRVNRVEFFAGLAGGFGFYTGWMVLVMLWQTATAADAAMKSVVDFVLGAGVGASLYLGVQFPANKKREAPIRRRLTGSTILGVVTGLVVAFLFGLLFYNPTGVGFTPIIPLG